MAEQQVEPRYILNPTDDIALVIKVSALISLSLLPRDNTVSVV